MQFHCSQIWCTAAHAPLTPGFRLSAGRMSFCHPWEKQTNKPSGQQSVIAVFSFGGSIFWYSSGSPTSLLPAGACGAARGRRLDSSSLASCSIMSDSFEKSESCEAAASCITCSTSASTCSLAAGSWRPSSFSSETATMASSSCRRCNRQSSSA